MFQWFKHFMNLRVRAALGLIERTRQCTFCGRRVTGLSEPKWWTIEQETAKCRCGLGQMRTVKEV
jgi:hypothetical protein